MRAARPNDGSPWNPSAGADLAFGLTGTAVPEPSALLLAGAGALGLLGYGWRRQSS